MDISNIFQIFNFLLFINKYIFGLKHDYFSLKATNSGKFKRNSILLNAITSDKSKKSLDLFKRDYALAPNLTNGIDVSNKVLNNSTKLSIKDEFNINNNEYHQFCGETLYYVLKNYCNLKRNTKSNNEIIVKKKSINRRFITFGDLNEQGS